MGKTVNKSKYQLIWNTSTKQIKIYGTEIAQVFVPETCTHFEGSKSDCDKKITDLSLIEAE